MIYSTSNLVNIRYWLAGCLNTKANGEFDFIPVNKFTETQPSIEEPLHCHNRAELTEAQETYAPLENAAAVITVMDAISGQPLAGAMATLSNEKKSYSLMTNDEGNVQIPITENGYYSLLTQKDEYVSEKLPVFVDCREENCHVELSVSMIPKDQAGGIEILLGWEGQAQDLDLHVVQVNSLDNRVACETFFNNLAGCKDASLNHNIKLGGLNGSEIVKLTNAASNSRFTYLVFAADNSVTGPSLRAADATLTITDGSFAKVEEMPAFTDATVAGIKYWFAGCLEIVGDSFNYAKVDKFSRESPYVTDKLYCDNFFKTTSRTTPIEPFCADVDMEVKVHDSMTNNVVPNASVTIIRIEEDTEETITEGGLSDEVGKTRSRIIQNGRYLVKIEADGYIAAKRDLEIKCKTSECDECKPKLLVALSPTLDPETIRITLSWVGMPNDLDFYVFRRTWSDWEDSCLTYYSKKTSCETATLDLDNRKGGDNGAETITFHNVGSQQDNVYMIFVQNYGYNPSPSEFKNSAAHITVTDGVVNSNADMSADSYNGEKHWVAGCLKIVGNSYEFQPLNVFFNSQPDEEVPDMCLDSFGFPAPTTKRPWYKIW